MAPSAQDALYLQLAREPDKNREKLQALVEYTAKRAGYSSPIVYHGTEKEFSDFSAASVGQMTGCDTFGFWFSDKFEAAEYYHSGEELGGRVISAYLRMDKPLDVTAEEFAAGYPDGPPKWLQKAAKCGHDGVVIHDIQDGDMVSTVYAVSEPGAIKSAAPVSYDKSGTVIPLSQRFRPDTDMHGCEKRLSRDDRYLLLAQEPEKNKEALRALLDEEAARKGFLVSVPGKESIPRIFFHGSRNDEFISEFNTKYGAYFTTDKGYAEGFSEVGRDFGAEDPKMYEVYLRVQKPEMYDGEIQETFDKFTVEREESELLIGRGFDGQIMTYDGQMDIRVTSPCQIKLADLVSYDDDGNVIPLSRRFDAGDDLRGEAEEKLVLAGAERAMAAHKPGQIARFAM